MADDTAAHEAARVLCDAWRDSGESYRAGISRDGTLLVYRPDGTMARLTEPQLRAVLAENARMREELAADALWAETADDLLAATVSETCDLDKYGNCATHGVLILGPGGECPHVQARAFLSSSRLHLAADATAAAHSATQTDAEGAQAREDANSSASAPRGPQEAVQQ